jgi:hypothetical protein
MQLHVLGNMNGLGTHWKILRSAKPSILEKSYCFIMISLKNLCYSRKFYQPK